MKSESLSDLYLDELKDLYDAEKQLVKALPKMAKAASAAELQTAITGHLEETKEHVARLEMLFDQLKMAPKGKTCEAMKGLIKEGQQVLEDHEEGPVRDAALIAAAQRVEHYEIAGYGTLRTFAEHLGRETAVSLLEQTLDEEKEADKKLTVIAESGINVEALTGTDAED